MIDILCAHAYYVPRLRAKPHVEFSFFLITFHALRQRHNDARYRSYVTQCRHELTFDFTMSEILLLIIFYASFAANGIYHPSLFISITGITLGRKRDRRPNFINSSIHFSADVEKIVDCRQAFLMCCTCWSIDADMRH